MINLEIKSSARNTEQLKLVLLLVMKLDWISCIPTKPFNPYETINPIKEKHVR
ncbi:hypothetical protein [Bacillus sp. T3]|uniref:hypothetical protein n=1 Tax=Bacillus sp. T3 TaxID=467262 RepID=UPI00298118BF|nr:hypothetical protein [Bacillus sp. T3]